MTTQAGSADLGLPHQAAAYARGALTPSTQVEHIFQEIAARPDQVNQRWESLK